MIVGFTGTQKGMTVEQGMKVKQLLTNLKPEVFHHGDCIGADTEAADIANELGIRIFVHPPKDDKKRAFSKWGDKGVPLNYLIRNVAIVAKAEIMIATPDSKKEKIKGSGTWYTIRKSRSMKRLLYIVWPDGTADIEDHR